MVAMIVESRHQDAIRSIGEITVDKRGFAKNGNPVSGYAPAAKTSPLFFA